MGAEEPALDGDPPRGYFLVLFEDGTSGRTRMELESRAQISSLLERIVTAQEDERARIARDLHDQLGQQLTPILLGTLLGLRHATDADHVVAVMTIVARERSLRRAAWVGAVWGVGHTLTLMLLGGAIIAA